MLTQKSLTSPTECAGAREERKKYCVVWLCVLRQRGCNWTYMLYRRFVRPSFASWTYYLFGVFWYGSFGPCNGIITLWSCCWTCYRITVLRIVYLLTIISNQKRPQPFSIQWFWRCCNISYTFAYKQQFRYVSVNINYRFGWWFASDSIERREKFSRKYINTQYMVWKVFLWWWEITDQFEKCFYFNAIIWI